MVDKKENEKPLFSKEIKYKDLDDVDVFLGLDILCIVNLIVMMSVKVNPKGDIFKKWKEYKKEEQHKYIYEILALLKIKREDCLSLLQLAYYEQDKEKKQIVKVKETDGSLYISIKLTSPQLLNTLVNIVVMVLDKQELTSNFIKKK